MKKCYVLDTSVLIHSPASLFAFSEHMVVLPEVVLEELDRFKTESSERGANSRQVIRYIDQLRSDGSLLAGVTHNKEGGILRIETNHLAAPLPLHWDRNKADNRILQVCKGLTDSGHLAILVSCDISMRVKASIIAVPAEDFRNERVASVSEQYTGRGTVYTSSAELNSFYHNDVRHIAPENIFHFNECTHQMEEASLVTNQFLLIRSTDDWQQTALGRFDGEKIVHLRYRSRNPFGVTPRSAGQIFMQECLMMSPEEAPLVIIKGPAGTAKTFYSLAVGLYKCMDCHPREYHHLLICRPNVPMDEDLGYLPGSEQEKIDPYMRAVRDNLFTLMSSQEVTDPKEIAQTEQTVQLLFERGVIRAEALAYQRGRSLQKYWMVLDEMQNSTPRQAKGVITRPGRGTKVILLGDPEQIDHPFLDSRNNGLVYASEKMKGSRLCFQVTLTHDECERSPLAAEASVRL